MIPIYLLILHSVVALEYLPSSKRIEVDEFDSYTFGIVKDNSTNITKCDYRSNVGLNGTFDVKPLGTRHVKTTQVENLGAMGLCQIKVKRVDDTLPTTWWLRHYSGEKRLGETQFLVRFYYKLPLVTNDVMVMENGDFYQYINTDLIFNTCSLHIGTKEIGLDIQSKTGRKVGGMTIVSFGGGVCGFRCANASKVDESWALYATDGSKKQYRAFFKYSLYANPSADDLYARKTVQIGMSRMISCGDRHTQSACYLFNSQNEFVPTSSEDCSHTIKTVSMEDLGVWRCQVAKFPSMGMLEFKVELVAGIDDKGVQTWTEENDEYATVGCKLLAHSSVGYCRMVSPFDDVFNVRPSAAFNRYLSIGTNFSQGICMMKIEKPLRESEKGQWRCEIDVASETTGGFISLVNKERRKYVTHRKVTTQLGEPLQIACQVSYSSDYCYIKSPNGTEYSMISHGESRLGKCLLVLKTATVKDVGNWSCFFAREMGLSDEEVTIEVRLAEVLWSSARVEVSSGENATLMCSSYGVPLKYCRFIAPNSQAYYIRNVQSSTRMRYYGKGLEYGECGITIQQAKPSDGGEWMCVTRLGGDYKQSEVSTPILLYVAPTFFEDPKVAIGFGTATLILAASAAAGYLGVKRWKRRGAHANLANSETSSQSGDAFGFNAPVSYRTEHNGEEEHIHQR